MKVPTGEASEGSKIIIKETEQSKFMDKYAQLKRFHNDLQLQVYMYAFMYVDPETMPVKDNFHPNKTFVVNYNKMSTPGPVPERWIELSYIRSENYELNQNFDETEKKQLEHTSNDKVKCSAEVL